MQNVISAVTTAANNIEQIQNTGMTSHMVIALIAVICWFPFYLCAIIKKKFFPEEYEKLNLAVGQE